MKDTAFLITGNFHSHGDAREIIWLYETWLKGLIVAGGPKETLVKGLGITVADKLFAIHQVTPGQHDTTELLDSLSPHIIEGECRFIDNEGLICLYSRKKDCALWHPEGPEQLNRQQTVDAVEYLTRNATQYMKILRNMPSSPERATYYQKRPSVLVDEWSRMKQCGYHGFLKGERLFLVGCTESAGLSSDYRAMIEAQKVEASVDSSSRQDDKKARNNVRVWVEEMILESGYYTRLLGMCDVSAGLCRPTTGDYDGNSGSLNYRRRPNGADELTASMNPAYHNDPDKAYNDAAGKIVNRHKTKKSLLKKKRKSSRKLHK